jgi:hypothetical protein
MPGSELAEKFMALHTRDGGFVMPNAWDGLSALMLADAGFEAIATSSAALAATLGVADGLHEVSRETHLEHARLLTTVSGLPVNGDFEDGYGNSPEDVAATVQAAIEFGLAGIGIEDTSGDPNQPIRDFDEAVDRVRSAVEAAEGRIVVTGRTDNFIQGRPDLDDTIRRLTAFAEVGAEEGRGQTHQSGPMALHALDGRLGRGRRSACCGQPRCCGDRPQLRAYWRAPCPRQELARTTNNHPRFTTECAKEGRLPWISTSS